MTVANKKKVVRVTSGLQASAYLATPMVDLLDAQACYVQLRDSFHPHGLCCSCGESKTNSVGHGKNRTGYPMYRCRKCGSAYSILSGTVFSGCTLGARRLLLFLRMVGAGRSGATIAGAVGLGKKPVDLLMAKVQVYGSNQGCKTQGVE